MSNPRANDAENANPMSIKLSAKLNLTRIPKHCPESAGLNRPERLFRPPHIQPLWGI